MLNHISIAVNDPEKVANVLAEFWNGTVLPFPPAPNSFFVLAHDGRGSAVEVTPAGTVLVPGEGLPPEDDLTGATEEYEAKFVKSDIIPKYVATHLNINTHLSIDEIKAIANREGWRTLVCNRGEGLFQLVEVWVENSFMLEVMTPEQTARYIEITSPEFIAAAFADALPVGNPNASVENLNVIG
ncbi:MAG TPA: hypothetical protein VGQ55_14595 [Pyrinomonadaceae bacterium]|jgi:hypothetical protein|nr:hypothetical protein [Pyrinomonadaceae bacterium]